jgi:hypothetical protein
VDSSESCTVKGVRYVAQPAPPRGKLSHICEGCAAFDGAHVNYDLCRGLPHCGPGAKRGKIVWVAESEAHHAD